MAAPTKRPMRQPLAAKISLAVSVPRSGAFSMPAVSVCVGVGAGVVFALAADFARRAPTAATTLSTNAIQPQLSRAIVIAILNVCRTHATRGRSLVEKLTRARRKRNSSLASSEKKRGKLLKGAQLIRHEYSPWCARSSSRPAHSRIKERPSQLFANNTSAEQPRTASCSVGPRLQVAHSWPGEHAVAVAGYGAQVEVDKALKRGEGMV
eukprot:6205774-Pleurochrysis_carterae.AAC.1